VLTQPSPSRITTNIATNIVCTVCGCRMPLMLIEPAYDGRRVDNHTFKCDGCGLTRIYTFDWGSVSGLPQFVFGRADRHTNRSSQDYRRPEGNRMPTESFVIRRNVAHYRDLLEGQISEAERKQVMKLLAEEEAKLPRAEARAEPRNWDGRWPAPASA
jgi:predicted Fe-S protein YdhL (DUF1289 family)